MNRSHYAEYNAALEYYLVDDMASFKKKISSHSLSQNEKRLHQARCFFQQKDWESGIESIKQLRIESTFLKAEQQFLLASGYLFSSQFELAAIHNLQAMKFYTECNDRRGLYLCHYNNSVAFSRIGLQEVSFYHLTLADTFASNADEHLTILRQQACYHSKKGDFKAACKLIDEALSGNIQNDRMEHLALKSTSIDIYFRSGRQQDALSLLTELKNSKMNWVQDRVSFEYALLKSLMENTPLTRIPEGIKDSNEYRLKWEIIKALQDGDSITARHRWNKLVSLMPQTFANNFQCLNPSDEKTIFFTCLQSQFICKPDVEENDEVVKAQLKSKKLIILYQMLKAANSPIRKEDLIEKIWETQYCSSYDARFYQLIKRLRPMITQEIINKNNCYILKQATANLKKCA